MKALVLVLSALAGPAVAPSTAPAPSTPAPSACEELARSCDRCDTRSAREIDQLQMCARSLFDEDEARCAAQIARARSACR